MKTPARHLVTAALPYANGPLHIGHIAGAYLPADIYVRNLRQRGKEVLFVCGSDEHGAAITMRAMKEGTTPKAIVDKYHVLMQRAFAGFGVHFDIYHRTSSSLHHHTSQEFFQELYGKGVFLEKEEQQYFDEQAGQFLADRYIMGTCPNCGNSDAYGDQCEKCGSALSPKDLVEPRSTLSGSKPVLRPTKHWYLPMENSQSWVEQWIGSGILEGGQHHDPKEWKPQVLGQCSSWLKDGLRPRAMTRDLDWGVPVPLEDAQGKVLYVWMDAPIGYISATRQWAEDHEQDWEKWWRSEDTRLVHFIGKDNIVFHCIIFPILLKAHGGYVLPQNVPANEFLNLEGQKISTSRNWAVWLHEYLERWPGREDVLRYTLTTIMPEFRDSEFTWKDLQDKNNNELVAIIGNFVQRVFVLCHKYYGGKAPMPQEGRQELPLWATIHANVETIAQRIDAFRFREALHGAMDVARAGNKYLTDTEPWKLEKVDPDGTRTVLFNALNIAATLGIILEPFLPFTAGRLRRMLNMNGTSWEDAFRTDLITPGQELGKAEHLFKPIADEEIQQEVDRLKAADRSSPVVASTGKEVAASPVKPNIVFEELARVDLRIGTIKAAERVPKADKLLKLAVDIGEAEPRTIVSGIAQHHSPEDLPGQQVLVVANLEPRKLRGVESKGMILMAEDENGKLIFLRPAATTPPGGEVK